MADRSLPRVLIGMVGLPYSGKTTTACQLGYPIVSPDAIRLALHGRRFASEAEPFVWSLAKVMVRALFLAGHQYVVLDACNQTEQRRAEWEKEGDGWTTSWRVLHTPAGECIRRALDAGDEEIVPVIKRMAESWSVPESCDSP